MIFKCMKENTKLSKHNCFVHENLKQSHMKWSFAAMASQVDGPTVIGSDNTVFFQNLNTVFISLKKVFMICFLNKIMSPLFFLT